MLPGDPMDLRLLKKVCSGEGLEINIARLSRLTRRHRRTVRDRVNNLLSHRIIDRPIFPFRALFREYPLLVVSYADLPSDERVKKWIREDANIFAAYRVREGESNMVIFEFHKDVWDYHVWRENLVKSGKIPERGMRAPSNNYFFSNHGIFKYEPNVGIELIERELKEEGRVVINGYTLDDVAVKVLRYLLNGEGIRVDENRLAKKLGVTRKTVFKRLQKLQEQGVILRPVCRFPHFFVPPNFLLVLSMVEVRGSKEKIVREIMKDPHVSLAYHISEGRYNLLLFEAHKSIDDYLKWEDSYSEKYPGCFGSIKVSFLSPRMTILIDQQKVSLGLISSRLKELSAHP